MPDPTIISTTNAAIVIIVAVAIIDQPVSSVKLITIAM